MGMHHYSSCQNVKNIVSQDCILIKADHPRMHALVMRDYLRSHNKDGGHIIDPP